MADTVTTPSKGRLATRAKNSDQHPGQIVKMRKRRTRVEIDRDNALQEEKKAQKKRQTTKGITRIAALEDQMAVDDASADAAHPRNQKGSLSIFFLSSSYNRLI
jgi:hypothetical protein